MIEGFKALYGFPSEVASFLNSLEVNLNANCLDFPLKHGS